jgi:hypothetical protein
MTKIQRVGLMLWVGTTLVLLAGCNKLIDYIKDHPDEDCTACKITKITSIIDFDIDADTVIATFTYTPWGDPASVTPTHISTGNPQYLFRYDSKHRLTDNIGAYDNGYYQEWFHYVYDSHDRIIRDTAYAFGLLNDRTNTEFGPAVTTYDYDSKGRVIHTTMVELWLPYPPREHFYSYDTNGNLVVPGAVYDNKINFRRTNKIWMFLSKNYSVNNAKPVTGYNDKGLPLKVVGYSSFLSFFGKSLEIEYKCN